MKRALQAVLSVIAIVCAVAIVRADLAEGAGAVDKARPVAAQKSAAMVVSKPTGKKVTGSFRLESVQEFPKLTPADEFSDPVGRKGGRVVVAVFDCTCPLGDDYLVPRAYAVDRAGRQWESDFLSPKDYAELAGLGKLENDFGKSTAYRFAVVFVVPSKVASSVDILMDPLVGEPRLFRR